MLVVLAAVVIAAVARPVEHAADAALRVIIDALEIAGIVVASAAGLAALAGLAVLGARVRQHRTVRAVPCDAARPVGAGRQDRSAELAAQLAEARAQLENGGQHVHFHGPDPGEIAAIISRQRIPAPPRAEKEPPR